VPYVGRTSDDPLIDLTLPDLRPYAFCRGFHCPPLLTLYLSPGQVRPSPEGWTYTPRAPGSRSAHAEFGDTTPDGGPAYGRCGNLYAAPD
jgi:hypothetical protein